MPNPTVVYMETGNNAKLVTSVQKPPAKFYCVITFHQRIQSAPKFTELLTFRLGRPLFLEGEGRGEEKGGGVLRFCSDFYLVHFYSLSIRIR